MATKVTEAFGVVKDNHNQGCGGIVEGFHQLKYVEKTIAAEGKDMVVAEAEATVTPTARSSMEWNSKKSNDASAQARWNIWALKESSTSPRSAQRPTIKYTMTSTAL